MSIEDIKKIIPGERIIDIRTGEELEFYGYDDPYVFCYDSRGITIWLTLDRVILK